ncbi:hypothetical protein [Acidipropionibacterium jensenii]|uniref:hypothetical protein n=1 Tax=Acidipropionibacterium jensenii TaxID=1749 RepID=UPI000FDB97F1|nr:hypothetical protein [Acidipropionibacterium jensenii]
MSLLTAEVHSLIHLHVFNRMRLGDKMNIHEMVRRMQTGSRKEADVRRYQIETQYVPNQVLKSGSIGLVSEILDGMDSATEWGQDESWELLGQLAAGTIPPTAADSAIVGGVRAALTDGILPLSEKRISDSLEKSYDYTCLEVLEILYEHSSDKEKRGITESFLKFAKRGAVQSSQVAATMERLRINE